MAIERCRANNKAIRPRCPFPPLQHRPPDFGQCCCSADLPPVELMTPVPPPEWALGQPELLYRVETAALEFTKRHPRPDGTFIWRDTWPGIADSDDG